MVGVLLSARGVGCLPLLSIEPTGSTMGNLALYQPFRLPASNLNKTSLNRGSTVGPESARRALALIASSKEVGIYEF